MKCPFCGSSIHQVIDKRAVETLGEIRRRRECLKCVKRFTTYERVAILELVVIKRDGRREPFVKEKLWAGIVKALEKRPGSEKVEEVVEKIERKLRKKGLKEIASKMIGQLVLVELKKLDTVAYLRFASVYRQFEHPEDFVKELQGLS
ncbi:MAG: transcriptional repressor NrdR [Armatimonadetes bacterium]|nr:MAG: transcriptional repressor NrdR [Armatimonadota bacterium]